MGFGGGKAQREREGPARGLLIARGRPGDERFGAFFASVVALGPGNQQPRAAARPCRRGALHRRHGRIRRRNPAARDDRGRRPDHRPNRAGDAAGDRLPRRLRGRDATARRLLRRPRPRSGVCSVHGRVRCRIRDHRDRRTLDLCWPALVGRWPRPSGTWRRRPGASDPCDRRRPLPR